MKNGKSDRGVTLIETMMAVLIGLIGVFGLGNLVFQATATSKNQGTETTRAVIYAQDKTEKLLSLASVPVTGQPDWASCIQPVSSQPAVCNTSGITSVTNWTTGLLAGGALTSSPLQVSCPTGAPLQGYMDFLDSTGAQYDACATGVTTVPAYVRMWQIADLSTSTVPAVYGPAAKQITVAVFSLSAVNTNGGKPIVIVSSVISNPN